VKSLNKIKREIVILAVAFGILLVAWIVFSWAAADWSVESEVQEVIEAQSLALNELTSKTAQSVDQGLDYLHEIPTLVASDPRVVNVLSRENVAVSTFSDASDRRRAWSNDNQLQRVDAYLVDVARGLKADTAWILNSSGDCVAASNVQTPDSFVGTNYADRDYFLQAKQGKLGQQYAIGRKTNVPGLYFSAQIGQNGKFLGVAVIKVDLPKLEHLVSQADTFITDRNGVIIMARDPSLEMHLLPNAAIHKMSSADRIARYKRMDFPLLRIVSWDHKRFPSLQKLDNEVLPVLISKFDLKHEFLGIQAFKRVPMAATFARDRQQRFWLISIFGAIVLLITASLLFFALLRKRSAYLSARSESLIRAAIESTADGILVINNSNQVSTYNQRFASISGLPAGPDTSARSNDILIPFMNRMDDSKKFLVRIAELESKPESDSFDSYCLKDGTQIECYTLPQRLHGNIVGRVWSLRDVTLQRQAERELIASRDKLEEMVQVRTQELQSANSDLLLEKARQEELIKQLGQAHQQLLQSEKLASVGQLAAGMAHEINTPIGFVKSNLNTLQKYMLDLISVVTSYEQTESQLNAESQKKIDALKKTIDYSFMQDDVESVFEESNDGIRRVAQIVQDLKDFSHVGQHDWCWANVEQGLESTIRVIWNDLKYKATVIKEYGAIPEIECIPSQLNHVFMNLMVNAVQAIERQGYITVRTGFDGEGVYVDISDTGIGIPEDKLEQIFDPFFTTKPVGHGTGLGLSISYGIVRQHLGRIEVTSKAGVGSTFRVWLPKSRRNLT
jgi:PAS domain S-box-containing protein